MAHVDQTAGFGQPKQTVHLHPMDGAERFHVNGWTPFRSTDSTVFYEQAHAVLAVVADQISDEDGRGPLNPGIVASALRGAMTLLGLGILASDNERAH